MKRSRLVIGLFVSLIAIASTGIASSIAWYQGATHLRVATLDINVSGEPELLLGTSPTKEAMKEKLVTEELNEVLLFAPVSTMFESRWRHDKQLPEFYEYGGLTRVDSDGTPSAPIKQSVGFYSQTLYLYSERDVYVGLDPSSCYVRAYEQANALRARSVYGTGFTIDEIVTRLNSLEKAMRLSFYDIEDDQYLIVDPYKENPTYYGGVLDTSRTGVYDHYYDEQGKRKEVVYGEVNDRTKILYDEGSPTLVEAEGELSSFNAGHEAHVLRYNEVKSKENGLQIAQEPSLGLIDALGSPYLSNNPFYVSLKAFTPKPIQVSIYLEGWDHDCVNANMGGSFLSQIQFKILRGASL